jgi:AcrR family transcriptional regulator
MTLLKEDIEAVRVRILDAAGDRFQQFGFGKTTMAEIAGDCGMSAANLYRYFENKHDIGAAMAKQCLSDKVQALKVVVKDGSLSASDKIESFILTNLRYTHGQWSDRPRMNELVDSVCHQRPVLVEEYLSQAWSMLGAILQDGVDAGEFQPCDLEATSEALYASMFMFDHPNAMSLCSLETFERKARGVARLALSGLQKR